MRPFYLFLLAAPLIFLSTLTAHAQTDLSGFAGQYVARIGQRNFAVLNLTVGGDHKLGGTLTVPKQMGFSTGITISSSTALTEPITKLERAGSQLRLIVQNPTDSTDTSTFDLSLEPAGQPTLTIVYPGFHFDPWPLVRVPPLPIQTLATDWDPRRIYQLDDSDVSSPEMQRLYDEDQKARQTMPASKAEGVKMFRDDGDRRVAAKKLLDNNALHTGEDFEHAAFLFQHGDTPDDFLLAHTLALVAIAKGQSSAIWIASATFDRYLNAIKQPQIYGTQFFPQPGTGWTQEPYNRTLVSDALRRQLGVPSLASQEKQLEQYKATTK